MAKRYEMLWDCPSCGTRKLLGLTHRPIGDELRFVDRFARPIVVEIQPAAATEPARVGMRRRFVDQRLDIIRVIPIVGRKRRNDCPA